MWRKFGQSCALLACLAFSVHANPIASSFAPEASPAIGGVTVTVTGADFPRVNNISCVWVDSVSKDVVRSAVSVVEAGVADALVFEQVTCLTPNWVYRSGLVDFYIESEGAQISPSWNFTLIEVCTSMSPTTLSATDQPLVTIRGAGFNAVPSGMGYFHPDGAPPVNSSFLYTITFSAGIFERTVQGVAMDSETIITFPPIWPYPPILTNVTLSFNGTRIPLLITEATSTEAAATTVAVTETYDYVTRGVFASGVKYNITQLDLSATFNTWCADVGYDDAQVFTFSIGGNRVRGSNVTLDIGGEPVPSPFIVNFTDIAQTGQSLKDSLNSVPSASVSEVLPFGFSQRMGITAMTFFVRFSTLVSQRLFQNHERIGVLFSDIAANTTNYHTRNVSLGNNTFELEAFTNQSTFSLESHTRWFQRGILSSKTCEYCPSLLSSGWNHVLGVTRTSATEVAIPYCFGDNRADQCTVPANFLVSNPHSMSAGKGHSCGFRADNTVRCWGPTVPQTLDKRGTPDGVGFVSFSAGAYHSCGVTQSRTIRCSGEDMYDKTHVPNSACLRKTEVARQLWRVCESNSSFTGIQATAGVSHSCAIRLDDSQVICWGLELYDRVGVVVERDPHRNPVYGRFGQFREVHAGLDFTCAIARSGEIECWGRDVHGQTCPPPGRYTQLAVGLHHACAVENGTQAVKCWGRSSNGEAQNPEGRFLTVSAGNSHSCGILLDTGSDTKGTVFCWGSFNTDSITNNPAQGARFRPRSSASSAKLYQPNSETFVSTSSCTVVLPDCETDPSIACAVDQVCAVQEDPLTLGAGYFVALAALLVGYMALVQPRRLPDADAPTVFGGAK